MALECREGDGGERMRACVCARAMDLQPHLPPPVAAQNEGHAQDWVGMGGLRCDGRDGSMCASVNLCRERELLLREPTIAFTLLPQARQLSGVAVILGLME